jgi:hypothetical protein
LQELESFCRKGYIPPLYDAYSASQQAGNSAGSGTDILRCFYGGSSKSIAGLVQIETQELFREDANICFEAQS